MSTPALGSDTGKIGPFVGWRGSGTNRRAEGSLDSTCEEYACACLCQEQSGAGTLKLHMMVAGFMQAPWSVLQPELSICFGPWLFQNIAPHHSKSGSGWWDSSVVRDKGSWDLGWHLSLVGEQSLLSNRQHIRSHPGHYMWPGRSQSTLRSMLNTCTSSFCSSTSPLWVEVADSGRKGAHTSREQRELKPSTQDFCSSNLRCPPTLDRVLMAAEQRRSLVTAIGQ